MKSRWKSQNNVTYCHKEIVNNNLKHCLHAHTDRLPKSLVTAIWHEQLGPEDVFNFWMLITWYSKTLHTGFGLISFLVIFQYVYDQCTSISYSHIPAWWGWIPVDMTEHWASPVATYTSAPTGRPHMLSSAVTPTLLPACTVGGIRWTGNPASLNLQKKRYWLLLFGIWQWGDMHTCRTVTSWGKEAKTSNQKCCSTQRYSIYYMMTNRYPWASINHSLR